MFVIRPSWWTLLMLIGILSAYGQLPSFAGSQTKLDSFSGNAGKSDTIQKKFYSCQVCKDLGKNCLGSFQTGCDYCTKVIGFLQNPEDVPVWAENYVNSDVNVTTRIEGDNNDNF